MSRPAREIADLLEPPRVDPASSVLSLSRMKLWKCSSGFSSRLQILDTRHHRISTLEVRECVRVSHSSYQEIKNRANNFLVETVKFKADFTLLNIAIDIFKNFGEVFIRLFCKLTYCFTNYKFEVTKL